MPRSAVNEGRILRLRRVVKIAIGVTWGMSSKDTENSVRALAVNFYGQFNGDEKELLDSGECPAWLTPEVVNVAKLGAFEFAAEVPAARAALAPAAAPVAPPLDAVEAPATPPAAPVAPPLAPDAPPLDAVEEQPARCVPMRWRSGRGFDVYVMEHRDELKGHALVKKPDGSATVLRATMRSIGWKHFRALPKRQQRLYEEAACRRGGDARIRNPRGQFAPFSGKRFLDMADELPLAALVTTPEKRGDG